jgi:hypothetical protein
VEASPDKTSPLPTTASDSDSKVPEADSSSNSPNSLTLPSLSGSFSKMFPGCSIPTAEKISEPSSMNWTPSGMAFLGEYLTLSTSERPNDAKECTLSGLMEASAPLRFFLDQDQVRSLLNRAQVRNKPLPEELDRALRAHISILSNTPGLAERLKQAHKERDTETTERPSPSTLEEAPMLFVRRLLPSECERLQGFPVGWTDLNCEDPKLWEPGMDPDTVPSETPSQSPSFDGLEVES